jgi:hypothetical protein
MPTTCPPWPQAKAEGQALKVLAGADAAKERRIWPRDRY